MNRKQARMRRARKTRARIVARGTPRLTVHRTPRHIYAQVIVREGNDAKVVAYASTLDKTIKTTLQGDKVAAAKVIGKAIGERAVKAQITKVAFDRSGFRYHGRVKALADAAREAGLQF